MSARGEVTSKDIHQVATCKLSSVSLLEDAAKAGASAPGAPLPGSIRQPPKYHFHLKTLFVAQEAFCARQHVRCPPGSVLMVPPPTSLCKFKAWDEVFLRKSGAGLVWSEVSPSCPSPANVTTLFETIAHHSTSKGMQTASRKLPAELNSTQGPLMNATHRKSNSEEQPNADFEAKHPSCLDQQLTVRRASAGLANGDAPLSSWRQRPKKCPGHAPGTKH